jgi:hypothetical protein
MAQRTIEKADGSKVRQFVDDSGKVVSEQKISKSGKHSSWKIIDPRTGKEASSPDKPPKGFSKGYSSFSHASAGEGKRIEEKRDASGNVLERKVIDKKTGKVLWKDVSGGATGAVLTNVIGKSRRIGGFSSKQIKSIEGRGKDRVTYEEYYQGEPVYKVEEKILKRLASKKLQKKGGNFVEVTPVEKELTVSYFRNGKAVPISSKRLSDREIKGRGDREYVISGLMKLLGKSRKDVEKMVRITKKRAKSPANPKGEITPGDVIEMARATGQGQGKLAEVRGTPEGVYGELTKPQKVSMHLSTLLSPKFVPYVTSLAPGGVTPQEVVVGNIKLSEPPSDKEIREFHNQRSKAIELYNKNRIPAHLATVFSPRAFTYLSSAVIPGGLTPRDVAIENLRRYSVEPARTGRKQKFLPYLLRSPAFQIPAFFAGGAVLGSTASPVVGKVAQIPGVVSLASSRLVRYGIPAVMMGQITSHAYSEYALNVQSGMPKTEAIERVAGKYGKEVANIVAVGVGLETGLKAGFPFKRKTLKTAEGRTFANALVLEYSEPRGAVKLLGKVDDIPAKELAGYEVGGSPFESKTVRRILEKGLPEEELFKLDFHQKYGGKLKGIPSQFVDPQVIREGTELLSNKAVKETLDIIKKEPHLVYGSQAGKTMYPGLLGRRAIHDIDIMIYKNADDVLKVAEKVNKRLNSLGYKTVLESGSSTHSTGAYKIYIEKPNGRYGKALEIFSKEASYGAGVPEGGWGFRYGLEPKKVKGVSAMSPGEHMLRKGGSILQVTEGGFAPAEHRMKDIVDYILTAKGQIASMEARPLMSVTRGKIIKSMKKDLKKLQKAWGVTDEMLEQGQFILGANIPSTSGVRGSYAVLPPTPSGLLTRPSSPGVSQRYSMPRASRLSSSSVPSRVSARDIYRRLASAQRNYLARGRPSRPSRASMRLNYRGSYGLRQRPSRPSAPSRPSRPSMPRTRSRPSRPSRPSPSVFDFLFSRPSRPSRSRPSKGSPSGSSPPSSPSVPPYYYYLFSQAPFRPFGRAPPVALRRRRLGRTYDKEYIAERERARRLFLSLFRRY